MLTKYMADTPCLPNVLKLRLIIRDKAFSLNRIGDDSVTNGLEFVDLLKLIAPAASWVIFRRDWGEYEGEAPGEDIVYDDENGMRTLIRQLFRNAKYLALDLGRVCITHTSTINNIPQLTALMMQDLTGLDVRTSLLHKTSSTLLDLRVGAIDPRLLICDINGNYIVYPNLKILVIDRFQMSITFEVPIPIVTPESIVPFPRLKSLALHTSYTFADNVLFRGNSSTLQHLIMYIDEDIVTKLNECKALENKHKALHSVVIDETGRDTNLSRVPESQLQEYFGNLLDTAHALKLESRYIVRELIGAMQNGCELNFIQKLHVKDSSLSLYGIMCLVKGLPALGMISCSIYGLDSEFEFIPAKELPNHIATTFENAGKNLHTWKLLNQTRSAFKNIAEYIVLLGLACPNLRRVMSRPCDAARYNAYIAKTIQREPYKKYAAQLTHLHNVAY
ncbi:hypothetical protein FBU31_001064 [Coemansia sp. 'formosensis']|nr:hypothetical protein FBU31_001064 [Coemansia sp. 'formosensis']